MAKPAVRKPTSYDVARLAGVSRSAVSRAFTPDANIAPDTKDKVIKAAAELGYRVNSLARGLQQKHSGIVGLVASRLDTPMRSRQVRRMSEALIRENFKPMLITAERPDDVGTLIESLLGYSVAGMIFTSDTPPVSVTSRYCARSPNASNSSGPVPVIHACAPNRAISSYKAARRFASRCASK